MKKRMEREETSNFFEKKIKLISKFFPPLFFCLKKSFSVCYYVFVFSVLVFQDPKKETTLLDRPTSFETTNVQSKLNFTYFSVSGGKYIKSGHT